MPSPEREAILARASSLLGIPYEWGGNGPDTLDCSAYVSLAWGVSRQSTDTLGNVADPIEVDELAPGDALNLPTWADPRGFGHVRLFDRWADVDRVWVYEETAELGHSVHRVVPWDDRFQPMRLRGLGPDVIPSPPSAPEPIAFAPPPIEVVPIAFWPPVPDVVLPPDRGGISPLGWAAIWLLVYLVLD